MTDTQLKCFLAAAKYENFTKAAESLYLSQPVVGRHISNLECELGVDLFVRDRKAVHLTENGKIFADFVEDLFAKYKEVNKQLHSNQRNKTMKLLLGTTEGQLIGDTLAPAFQYIAGNVPSLKISVSTYTNKGLIEALKQGLIDSALLDFDDIKSQLDIFDFKVVRHVNSCLIVPKSHPNAKKKTFERYDFQDQRFILLSDEDNDLIMDLQREHMKWLGITQELIAPDITTFATWAEAGLGVTTIPDNHKLHYSPNVIPIEIPEICYHSLEVFTWPKNRFSPPVSAFCDILDKSGYQTFSDDYRNNTWIN